MRELSVNEVTSASGGFDTKSFSSGFLRGAIDGAVGPIKYYLGAVFSHGLLGVLGTSNPFGSACMGAGVLAGYDYYTSTRSPELGKDSGFSDDTFRQGMIIGVVWDALEKFSDRT